MSATEPVHQVKYKAHLLDFRKVFGFKLRGEERERECELNLKLLDASFQSTYICMVGTRLTRSTGATADSDVRICSIASI